MEYGENNGDVWEIFYYTRKKVTISDEEEQKLLDSQTRELNSTFSPPSGLSAGDYSSMFLEHFMKARRDAKNIVQSSTEMRIRNRELFQLGNRECVDSLQKIESSHDFDSWENPSIVDYFRQLSSSMQ